ncbi:MAG: cytochrome, partial [Frankiales bacterium]|nr:cytochrome [Frankiales bacterium]
LMRHPEQYALLRSDPGLALGVVDETLRYDSPARSQPRVATEDLELGGRQIRAGDMVAVIANAANRDPAAFPDPETFDITRGSRRHLSFGGGIHHCVGSALARMEAEVFFRRIGELDEVLELDTEAVSYKPNHGRNLTALPVRVR